MISDAVVSHPARQKSSALSITLWIAQVILFGMFAMAGFLKTGTPIGELSRMIPWAADVPVALVRFIGLSELLGAIGVLLPALTRVKPFLTPLAGAGLAVIMILAIGFHIMRGEFTMLGMPALLGSLAAFVAWGRFYKAPINPR